MPQLFMGLKPGVGPVVKVMKGNDNPLTTPNTDYSKYLFNSENQHLSYMFGSFSIAWTYSDWSSLGLYYYGGGDATTAPYEAWVSYGFTGQRYGTLYGRLKNIYPNRPFLPMPEVRYRLTNGRYAAGQRRLRLLVDNPGGSEFGAVESSQFCGGLVKVTRKIADGPSVQHNYNFPASSASTIDVGDWVTSASSYGLRGISGMRFHMALTTTSSSNTNKFLINYWNLPADSSPMPTYTNSLNLDTMEIGNGNIILTRPGYSIQSSAGINQRILDSTIGPALVVAAGRTPSIASGGNYLVTTPNFITLSETATMDMMVRRTGDTQFIPPHIPSGYVRNSSMDVQYVIEANGIRIYNDGSDAVEVTYIVFNTDETPPSTGGQNILFRGNDGTQDFVQIKKPGTTDPASRPGDILLDTRLPTIHILDEGWLPLSSFTDASENPTQFGKRAKRIDFDAQGMLPFVKFMTVFENYILPPSAALMYFYGPAEWGPMSNQSSLCRLESNYAKFFLTPLAGDTAGDRWSRMTIDGVYRDLPDPLGIRYYIFGIPQ